MVDESATNDTQKLSMADKKDIGCVRKDERVRRIREQLDKSYSSFNHSNTAFTCLHRSDNDLGNDTTNTISSTDTINHPGHILSVHSPQPGLHPIHNGKGDPRKRCNACRSIAAPICTMLQLSKASIAHRDRGVIGRNISLLGEDRNSVDDKHLQTCSEKDVDLNISDESEKNGCSTMKRISPFIHMNKTPLMIILTCIIILSYPNRLALGVVTFALTSFFAWAMHAGIHNFELPFKGSIFHRFHHNTEGLAATSAGMVFEFIVNIIPCFVSIHVLPDTIIHHEVMLLFTLIYCSMHMVNYHVFGRDDDFHLKHHGNAFVNYGPSYMDAIMGTHAPPYENMWHYVPNTVIFTILLIVSRSFFLH